MTMSTTPPAGPSPDPLTPLPAALQTALRAAAHELNLQQPPAQLVAAVQRAAQAALAERAAQVARQVPASPAPTPTPRPAQHQQGWARPGAWPTALACAAVVLVSLVLMLSGPPPATSSGHDNSFSASSFVPVVPQDAWPDDDAPAWLVSTELRADRLAALGLPFDPARAGEGRRAELLVRASGQVLALRFVE